MATPSQVKDRVVALYALISGVTTSIDDYPEDGLAFEDAELVVAITFLRPSINTPFTKRAFIKTQTLETHLFVAPAEAAQSYPDTSAREAVEAYQISVPLFFVARQQLDDPATGLGTLVRNITLPNETEPGPGRLPFSGVDYWGLIFTMTTETLHTT